MHVIHTVSSLFLCNMILFFCPVVFILASVSGSIILVMPFRQLPALKNQQGRSLFMMEEEAMSPFMFLTKCIPRRCPKFALILNFESSCLPTKLECWNTGLASQTNSSFPNMWIGNTKRTQTCTNLQSTKHIPQVWPFLLTGRKWPPSPLTGRSGSSVF